MLTFPGKIAVYLAESPVDCRKSFDGLAALVEHQCSSDPMSGDVYVFLNKRCNHVRLLFWERNGFCIIAKRLEAGTFRRVKKAGTDSTHVEIGAAELSMLLEGIDARFLRRSKRYVPCENSDNDSKIHGAKKIS